MIGTTGPKISMSLATSAVLGTCYDDGRLVESTVSLAATQDDLAALLHCQLQLPFLP